MNIAKIWMVFVLALVLIVPVVSASVDCSNLDSLTGPDACGCIQDKINSIIMLLTGVAGGVAVIAAIVVGIMFMNAGDPSEKDRLGGRLKALIIGIIIVALANPLVRVLLGAVMDCSKVAP